MRVKYFLFFILINTTFSEEKEATTQVKEFEIYKDRAIAFLQNKYPQEIKTYMKI